MAVKHRRMGWHQGDSALEDLRETIAVITKEEAFAFEADASPKNSAEIERKFPVVKVVR